GDDRIYIGDFVMQLVGAPPAGSSMRSSSAPHRAEAPVPPAVPKIGKGPTEKAPPASMLAEDSEAATRAIDIDELDAEVEEVEVIAASDIEVEPDESVDDGLEVEFEVEEEQPEAAVSVDDVELEEEEAPTTMAIAGGEAPAAPPSVPPPVSALPSAPPAPTPSAPPAPTPSAPPAQPVAVAAAATVASTEIADEEPEPEPAAPAPRSDSVRREVPAPEPRGASDDGDARFETYIGVLDELHRRVATSVFADIDPEQLDHLSDRQWSDLETAVGAVVSTARAGGLVPNFLDDATLTHDVLYEFTGVGPVEYFLDDDAVTRIQVNDFNQILVTADGATEAVWKSFSSPAALSRIVDRLASTLGFTAGNRPPMLVGELPDGTGFQVVLPPLAAAGPVLSFTKPSRRRLTMKALLDSGAITSEDADFLAARVQDGANIAVVGRSPADRASVLGALALFASEEDRLVIVEARHTLSVPHRNVTRLRLPILPDESAQLFRVLPLLLGDRLLVAPVTGADAAALIELAHSGAEGVLGSFYGRDADDGLSRLSRQVIANHGAPNEALATGLVQNAFAHVVFVQSTAEGLRVTVEDTGG
ncbi:MAG: Flp pilus assembly complex ATPase component TadA, partial [Myxococcales bacterium]|nr:Flp pilus assembly complex ATPase component TadA [Myxococcales bacterium]